MTDISKQAELERKAELFDELLAALKEYVDAWAAVMSSDESTDAIAACVMSEARARVLINKAEQS